MVVEAVQMPAWVERAGWRTPLAPGSRVWNNEQVETGSGAALVLQMPEGSLVRLGEKTKLNISRFESDAQTGQIQVRAKISLLEGFFRFATSSVSKALGQRQIELAVRTATVGIRGTDFWSMTDKEHDAACVFEGHIDVQTQDQGTITLDQPTAFWSRFYDKPPQPAGQATPAQLQKFLSSTELQPGTGVAVYGGMWRVVVASFGTAKEANELAKRLRALGYAAGVQEVGTATGKSYQTRMTQMASKADATALLAKIADQEGVSGRVEAAT